MKRIVFISLLTCLITATHLNGAAFMKLGDIKGESQAAGHEGEIDILSWSWGIERAAISGGGGAGKATFKELSCTKELDKASPKLMEACANGTNDRNAIITLTRSGATGEPQPYLIITMEKVLVTSVSTGGSSGEDRPTEEVTLNYSKIIFEYTEQRPDGTPGETVVFGWDVENNVPIDPAAGA